MSIGYACIALGLPRAHLRSVMQKNATDETIASVIDHNLDVLSRMLDYNQRNSVALFRISSDIIPFGSSPVNTLNWETIFAQRLAELGKQARGAGIRLSMHPGQYTVLNSPDPGVVERAIDDLVYHNAFLDALGMDSTNKLILHVGGAYGDKPAAIERFVAVYDTLPTPVKRRLIIENDDRLYTAEEVLAISHTIGAPMVFDVLHHRINPGIGAPDEIELIDRAGATWHDDDGRQKIHYSQQAEGKRPGSHSDTIAIDAFDTFWKGLGPKTDSVDIMLEVKDKDLSALKCIDCTNPNGAISALEGSWARYKYTVLEHDPAAYQHIRTLLKDKSAYPAREFYQLVEQALATPATAGTFRNAVQHVWGYVSDHVDAKERTRFERLMGGFEQGKASETAVKKRLASLAEKYHQDYLLASYYFVL